MAMYIDGISRLEYPKEGTRKSLIKEMNSTKVQNPLRKIHMQALDAGITPYIVNSKCRRPQCILRMRVRVPRCPTE